MDIDDPNLILKILFQMPGRATESVRPEDPKFQEGSLGKAVAELMAIGIDNETIAWLINDLSQIIELTLASETNDAWISDDIDISTGGYERRPFPDPHFYLGAKFERFATGEVAEIRRNSVIDKILHGQVMWHLAHLPNEPL